MMNRAVRVVMPRESKSMKTAISIPDEPFEAADALAQRMGTSRSRLSSCFSTLAVLMF
jgi:hypothetical protein